MFTDNKILERYFLKHYTVKNNVLLKIVVFYTLIDSINDWNGIITGNVTFDTANNCMSTEVKNLTTKIPTIFMLGQNFPNPFNPTT
ncbi:MAG: hypothetical protein JW917_01350 [Ignavibacteria bacterium]|nr:hypothetical protein [Ignavibacteria bacterium]